ncbi:MAG: hypothetical protein ABL931_10580, partial [Usitatibacteraceae bacterium]
AADTQLPSNAVSADLAIRMQMPITRWRRLLRGDIDTIAIEALRKSPADRYPGVDALRLDIERYLDGQPVLARRDSEWYRLGKFITRNKLAVGAAGTVAIALLLGISVSLWQAQLALREANKARAVQTFLTSLLEKNSRLQAGAAKSQNMTVREVLVEASERVPAAFHDAPALRAELSVKVATLLNDVDEFERAAKLFGDAVTISKAEGLGSSDLHVEALIGMTASLRVLGKGSDALAARDQAIALLDARGDTTSLLRARAGANSVSTLSRYPERELKLTMAALELYESRYPHDPGRFAAAVVVAQVHRSQGYWTSAEKYFRNAIALFPQVGSKDYVNLGGSHAWAAFCASKMGRIDTALKDFQTGIQILTEHAGGNALSTRFHRGLYAQTLHTAGRRDESHRLFAELERTVVSGRPTFLDFDNAIYHADALVNEGRPQTAIALLSSYSERHIELGKRFLPSGVRWATLLAKAHAMLGNAEKAESVLKRIADLPQQYSIPPQQLVDYKNDVSWILLAAKRFDDANATLKFGEDHPNGNTEYFNLAYVTLNIRAAEIASRAGDPALASARAELAIDHLTQWTTPSAFPYLRAAAFKARGDAQLGMGDAAAAAESLGAALKLIRALQDAASPWLADTLASLAMAHRKLGQERQARASLAEARLILRQYPTISADFSTRLAEATLHTR